MTEVTFHFNVPEKTAYACRLLRKAWAARAPFFWSMAAPFSQKYAEICSFEQISYRFLKI